MIHLLLILLCGGSFSQNRTILMVEGDSNTEGNAMACPDSNWAMLTYLSYPVYDTIWMHSVAVGGKTLETMIAQAPDSLDPNATDNTYCLFMGGINSYGAGASVDSVYKMSRDFCIDRVAAGLKVVFIIYPSNTLFMDTVNTMIVDSSSTWGLSALIRTDLDANIGFGSDHDNRTYWEGYVHLNPGGQIVVRDLVVDQINILTGRI